LTSSSKGPGEGQALTVWPQALPASVCDGPSLQICVPTFFLVSTLPAHKLTTSILLGNPGWPLRSEIEQTHDKFFFLLGSQDFCKCRESPGYASCRLLYLQKSLKGSHKNCPLKTSRPFSKPHLELQLLASPQACYLKTHLINSP
jgi:hypothetical protein